MVKCVYCVINYFFDVSIVGYRRFVCDCFVVYGFDFSYNGFCCFRIVIRVVYGVIKIIDDDFCVVLS